MADEGNIIDRALQTYVLGLIFFFGGFWLFLVLWTPYKRILPGADTNDIQRSKAAVALELQKWLILRNEVGQIETLPNSDPDILRIDPGVQAMLSFIFVRRILKSCPILTGKVLCKPSARHGATICPRVRSCSCRASM